MMSYIVCAHADGALFEPICHNGCSKSWLLSSRQSSTALGTPPPPPCPNPNPCCVAGGAVPAPLSRRSGRTSHWRSTCGTLTWVLHRRLWLKATPPCGRWATSEWLTAMRGASGGGQHARGAGVVFGVSEAITSILCGMITNTTSHPSSCKHTSLTHKTNPSLCQHTHTLTQVPAGCTGDALQCQGPGAQPCPDTLLELHPAQRHRLTVLRLHLVP